MAAYCRIPRFSMAGFAWLSFAHACRKYGAAGTRLRGGAAQSFGGGAVNSVAICSPRYVTRGESFKDHTFPKSFGQAVKVDWLNATFPGLDSYTPANFVVLLTKLFGRPVTGFDGHGMFGFTNSVKLFTQVGSSTFAIGCLAWGGVGQKGRWMLQLTGSGCSVVRSWPSMARFLKVLKAKITRLDLALDCLHGEYSVDDAVGMYQQDAFNCGGRRPSSSVAGDWLGRVKGRTLYVGNSKNGKMLRVYEKGMQLGAVESPWVRFEVQLGNRDRVIPFAALVQRDTFFAGCYPALQFILKCAATEIETTRTEGAASLAWLMFHLKNSYGKLLNVVAESQCCGYGDLVEAVTVYGVPRRLKPASVGCGLTWSQLLDQLRGFKS